MSDKHPLVSEGSWVELRDPHELRAGDKRHVLRAVTDPERVLAAGLDIVDGLICMMVVNWQLPDDLPLPSQSAGVLDLLRIPDYDRLCELVEPARQLLFPEASTPPQNQEQAKDPTTPTLPSVG